MSYLRRLPNEQIDYERAYVLEVGVRKAAEEAGFQVVSVSVSSDGSSDPQVAILLRQSPAPPVADESKRPRLWGKLEEGAP
jgi:hypothetical protein